MSTGSLTSITSLLNQVCACMCVHLCVCVRPLTWLLQLLEVRLKVVAQRDSSAAASGTTTERRSAVRYNLRRRKVKRLKVAMLRQMKW